MFSSARTQGGPGSNGYLLVGPHATLPLVSHDPTIYRDRAESFFNSMRSLVELGDEDFRCLDGDYTSSVVLLAVHAAISFSDAVLVTATGTPSSGSHDSAADLLAKAIKANKLDPLPIARFRRLIKQKHACAYGPKPLRRTDAESARLNVEAFASWAYEVLQTLSLRKQP